MKHIIIMLSLAASSFSQTVTVPQRISDSLAVLRSGSDTAAKFTRIRVDTLRAGTVGFYGGAPVSVPCEIPYATPPNPVTAAQERAAYDLALQNCLDESGVNLVNTP